MSRTNVNVFRPVLLRAFRVFPVAVHSALWQTIVVDTRALNLRRIAAAIGIVAILAYLLSAGSPQHQPSVIAQSVSPHQDVPQPIYSRNPNDPWNRIFSCLFSRHVEARLSDEFPEGAPFRELAPFDLRVSTNLFDRMESGDRAIDPLYAPPADSPEGSRQILVEPRYSELTGALQEALREPTPRPAIARAMMQSDLWSAYDRLYWPLFPEDRNTELDRHKQVIAGLLGHFITKLALTPEEIQSLPDNYNEARFKDSLPDLFNQKSGWFEFQYIPHRMHDEAAGFRRVTRLFVKATRPPRDKKKFLSAFRGYPEKAYSQLDGVGLLIQSLLIDTSGNLSPTHLTTDVQIRLFTNTSEGAFARTDLQLAELSRRLMLREPAWGGLAPEDENSPTYMAAGGEYGFASPISVEPHDKYPSPVLVRQRTRCAFCHSPELTTLMSFNFARPPQSQPFPITIFDPASHQAADYVISRKLKRPEWQALRAYFASPTASTR